MVLTGVGCPTHIDKGIDLRFLSIPCRAPWRKCRNKAEQIENARKKSKAPSQKKKGDSESKNGRKRMKQASWQQRQCRRFRNSTLQSCGLCAGGKFCQYVLEDRAILFESSSKTHKAGEMQDATVRLIAVTVRSSLDAYYNSLAYCN